MLLVCSTLDTIQSRRFLLLTARQFSFKLLLKGIRNLHWGNEKVALVGDSRIKTQIIQNPITQTPIAMKDIRQAIILSTLNIRVVVYQQSPYISFLYLMRWISLDHFHEFIRLLEKELFAYL